MEQQIHSTKMHERRKMKQITIRIDDEQYNKLKSIEKSFRMRGISSLIRRSIDIYLETFPHCDEYVNKIREERRIAYGYDEY